MHLHLLSVLFCCLISWLAATPGAAADPTAVELLSHLQERDARYANTIGVGEWIDSTAGTADSWAVTTIHRTADGRIRVHTRSGSFGPNGERIPNERREHAEMFDGTLQVNTAWHPDRDRVGRDLSEAEKAQPHPGYHTALVYAGIHDDPHATRTPWGISQGHLTHTLPAIIAGKGSYSIQCVDPGARRYQVTYRLDDEEDPHTYIADVDGGRGWIVPRIVAQNSEGAVMSERVTDFVLGENETWVPCQAYIRYWGGDNIAAAAPKWEWRCMVQRFDVNPLGLTDKSFDIVLAPDTSVYDVRHHKTYRMPPGEPSVNPDFDLFALEAAVEDLGNQAGKK